MSQPEFDYLGPYKVERTLGRGGMGTVYQGVHAKSGESVAIKVIATGIANHMRFRRRFAAEVETLKRLKHPNIVQLVGYGEEQGLLFYSMEYVDGHSLHDHLRQHGKLPWQEVVQVGIETTAALKHAHDLGIIHRDLKPANLMANRDGHIKLTDFGIAKLFGSTDMTAAGAVIGTADYMPPEQAEGKAVTARGDLYSLGGVLYALLTGRAPFSGKSVPEVLYAVRYNPVPPLRERVPDVPKELAELIHQLLEKDPQKRPPTALVVGNRLKSLQQGLRALAASADAGGSAEGSHSAVGTQLTSLDLSDVVDDEMKLTGDEPVGDVAGLYASHEAPDDEPLDTHEQQTVLASDQLAQPSVDRLPTSLVSGDPGDQADDNRASEFASEVSAGFDMLNSQGEPLSAGGPSHYTPISEEESRPTRFVLDGDEPSTGVDWLHYVSIAGMIVLLLSSLGAGWWMLRPATADQLYQRINTAVDTGEEGPLLQSGGAIAEFLQAYPDDPRGDELRALQDEIELARSTRILQRRASRAGGTEQLSALEQGFLDCMQLLSRDVDRAQESLVAFVKVFSGVEGLTRDEQRLLKLAEHALRTGGQAIAEQEPRAAAQLQQLIESAESALPPERLRTFYGNLLLLYGDKPWAQEHVVRIRAKLDAES